MIELRIRNEQTPSRLPREVVADGKVIGEVFPRAADWHAAVHKVITDDVAEHVYAAVNSEVKRLSGNDALSVWLKNKSAVSGPARKSFSKINNVIGRKRMQKLADLGLSSRVYKTAVSIAAFIGDDDVCRIVDWLLSYSGTGMIGQIMKALEVGEGKKAIIQAVNTDKPVKISLGV